MFDDWKRAWREAVENFRRELDDTESASGDTADHVRAMHRDVGRVRDALRRVDAEISQAQREADAERAEEQVCRRREGLARNIGDQETVRLAAEYAVRHAERAVIFERKAEVLIAERELLARDLTGMEETLGRQPAVSAAAGPPTAELDEHRRRVDRDFGRLEREAREKAAAERLEELKKKIR